MSECLGGWFSNYLMCDNYLMTEVLMDLMEFLESEYVEKLPKLWSYVCDVFVYKIEDCWFDTLESRIDCWLGWNFSLHNLPSMAHSQYDGSITRVPKDVPNISENSSCWTCVLNFQIAIWKCLRNVGRWLKEFGSCSTKNWLWARVVQYIFTEFPLKSCTTVGLRPKWLTSINMLLAVYLNV